MNDVKPKPVYFKRILCLIFVLSILCSGCSTQQSSCKRLFRSLESACNECDIEGMIDCLSPSYAKPLKTAYSVGTSVIGTVEKGLSLVFDLISSYAGFDDLSSENSGDTEQQKDTFTEAVMKSVQISPTDYDLDKESGTVTCKIYYTVSGTEKETVLYFDVVKIEEEWYINGFSRSKTAE